VGTRTIAVEEGSLHSYLGGWPEYVRVREERRAARPGGQAGAGAHLAALRAPALASGRPAPAGPDRNGAVKAADAPPKARPKRAKAPSKNRLSDQQKAEQAVEQAEAALRGVEEELADPAAWATQYESAKSQARHTAATRAVEQAYASFEALSD
jgi:ATP-binding cassette subfamily F protein 3